MKMKSCVLVIVILSSIIVTHSFSEFDEDAKKNPRMYEESNTSKHWYRNIPLPAMALTTLKSLQNNECKNQLEHFIRDLENGRYWAVQMFDSSVKYPSGIIEGTTMFLGNFDECYNLNVKIPDENNHDLLQIRGKYCLVDFKYEQIHSESKFDGKYLLDFNPMDSVWEAIKERGDYRRVKRYHLQMAVCIPSACSNQNINNILSSVYNEFGSRNNMSIDVSVRDHNCQTYDEEPTLSKSAVVLCTVIVIIIGLVIAGTLLCNKSQSEEEEKKLYSTSMKLLLCFSIRRNCRSIFQKSENQQRSLDCINAVRFLFTCFAIFGHRSVFHCYVAIINAKFVEKSLHFWNYILLYNGTAIVSGFFALSGLLTSYALLGRLEKTKRFDFFILVITRFIRFTPAYAVIIFFFAKIFPYLGSGPLWKVKVIRESEFCAKNWWTNLLYLNNFIKSEEICIFQTWYLSADFHFYIMGLFLIYIFWKLPRKVGYLLYILLLICNNWPVFYVTYVNRLLPSFIPRPTLASLQEDDYFLNYYMKSYYHLPSYTVGIIFGTLLYDSTSTTWRLSKRLSNILFPMSIATGIGSIYFGGRYFDPNTNTSAVSAALYASLHRTLFASAVCVGILLMHIGTDLDIYYNFMSHPWFQPLGRLSYGVFLVHGFVHFCEFGTARSARSFTAYNVFSGLVSDVFFSYCISLLITVCIEGPFRKMEKVLFWSERRPSIFSQQKPGKEMKKTS